MDALKQQFNEQIKSLMPISGLAPQHQNEVVQQGEILTFKKKQPVFKQGDVDPYTYYLLDGELELEANGQLLKTIKGGSPDAQSALSQLQPRQMGAKSKGKSLVLRIPRAVMDRLLTMDDAGTSAGAVEVSEVDDDEDGGGDWMTRMLQSELFSRIPPANIQRLFTVMESVNLKAGSVVVEQGSPGDYYYIIQAGCCEVTRKASASGEPIKLAELRDGDSFGEEALVSDAKRNATVSMITDGELVRLTKEDFIELIKKPSVDSVDYEVAKALVADGACWLDLRFSEEHAKNGIEASVNLPLNQLRGELKNLESDRIYIAYCDSGTRSSAGAFLLAQNGFDVRHLAGGLIASHGVAPVEEPSAPPGEPEIVPEEPSHVAEANEPEPEPEPKSEPKPEPKPEPEPKPKPKPKPKEDASTPEVKASPKSDNADVRAAELSEDVAKADTKMEEAMRVKAQADAEQRAAAKKLQSKSQQLKEKAAQAKAELQKRAAQANAALEKAKRERVELEKARRAAETEAEAKREEDAQSLEQLKQENEARLNAERTKLEAEYAKQAEELAKLQELKETAKAELKAEREVLERKTSAANRELKKAVKAKTEAEDIERKIREQSEVSIRAERQRLEAEFARAAEQLAEAQREREMAELIKDEAAKKAARTIAEQKVAQEVARQEEELKLQAERQKLRDEAQRLRQSLEEAKKAKAKAQARAIAEVEKRKKLKQQEAKVAREMIASSRRKDARAKAASTAQDDELARANSLLAAAEAAHRQAEEAKQDLEDTQSWKKSELESLRKQMEAELSEFMNENPAPKKDDEEQKKRAARLTVFEKRRKAEENKRAEANKSILNDIASQLEK